jgi:hypothetical protein
MPGLEIPDFGSMLTYFDFQGGSLTMAFSLILHTLRALFMSHMRHRITSVCGIWRFLLHFHTTNKMR